MSHSVTTSESWFGRIGGAFKGIIAGGLLFLVSFPLLFWNEGRAVHRAQTLALGRGAVIENVDPSVIDSGNEGALVHLSGMADNQVPIEDSVFKVVAENSLQLRRIVEMYQWKEETDRKSRKRVGGSLETTTTYSYDKVWSETPIDSSDFNQDYQSDFGAGNPPMPIQSEQFFPPRISLGAFRLNENQMRQLGGEQDFPVDASIFELIEDRELRQEIKFVDGGVYVGYDPENPEIGDLKIRFQTVTPQTVSLIAAQAGDSFGPFEAPQGSIEMFAAGEKSADELFTVAERNNNFLLWLIRLAGFVLMAVGVGLILRPLVVFADVLPFAGSLVGFGVAAIALMVAAVFSLFVIGIAWLFYRPLLATGLFVAGGLLIFAIRRYLRNGKVTPAAMDDDGIPVVG